MTTSKVFTTPEYVFDGFNVEIRKHTWSVCTETKYTVLGYDGSEYKAFRKEDVIFVGVSE